MMRTVIVLCILSLLASSADARVFGTTYARHSVEYRLMRQNMEAERHHAEMLKIQNNELVRLQQELLRIRKLVK